MSGFSKKLFEALEKLNEMGQLLLVVNNLPNITESEKKQLKDLAIKKDQSMLKSLEKFKADHNLDVLRQYWKNLIQSPSSFIEEEVKQIKPAVKSKTLPGKYLGIAETVKKTIENVSLINMRSALGLDKKNPKELMVQLKNSFKLHPFLKLEEFSQILLQIDATSEPYTKLTRQQALNYLFAVLDENKDNQLSKEEVLNNLIVLSGGTPEEKISALFMIYNTEGDGLITYQNVLDHLKHTFQIGFMISPSSQKWRQSAESIALATTEAIFQKLDINDHKLICENEYLAWYNQEEPNEEVIADKHLRVQARLDKQCRALEAFKSNKKLASKENLGEIPQIKVQTGLGKVPVHYALKLFKEKNSSGYFSRQQFSDIVQELVQMYNPKFETGSNFYSALCRLFTKFDSDGNGVIDKNELFSGLSLVCAGSLGDKISAVCHCFDESGDGLMQYPEVLKYFQIVFKMIYPEHGEHIVDIESLSQATAENLFSSLTLTKDKSINSETIKKWLIRL